MTTKPYCDHCHDGNGECVFPYMGLAPHKHTINRWTGTEFDKREDYPANFSETEEGMGIYTHCLECGSDEYNEQ